MNTAFAFSHTSFFSSSLSTSFCPNPCVRSPHTPPCPLHRSARINTLHVKALLPTVPPSLDPSQAAQSLSDLYFNTAAFLTVATASVVSSEDAAAAAAAAAERAAEHHKGWFGTFTYGIERCVTLIHDGLAAVGTPYAYGFAIILFTVLVKAVLFPLTYKQMMSTMKMQALAPKLKKIQNDYRDNPQVMQQMTADLYRTEKINPLAGCLPVLAQLPIWIALYRAVLNLADANLIDEPFFFIPSLQGPVARTGESLSTWLFPLVNGAPPVGWHDALCYLVLPILLVATQFYSQEVLTPKSDDPAQQQTQAILKFLPFLIGWFSLNVPSGLGVYWVTNNVLTTASTLIIREMNPALKPQTVEASASETISPQKKSGFSSPPSASSSQTSSSSKKGKGKKK